MPRSREVHEFERIVVIGGGCYGSWYTQQILRARSAGALHADEIVVVDRNRNCKVVVARNAGEYGDAPVAVACSTWSDYLTHWLNRTERDSARDALVPSPLMPHLLLDWLVERARERGPERNVRVEPLNRAPRVPWERAAPDGRHYVSFAEWLCPTNCVEPALCPATRGPRSWSMPPAISAYVNAQPAEQPLAGPVLFHCVHRTHGVGMIDARTIVDANDRVAEWSATGAVRVLVGTVSHCHGALGVLAVD